MNLLEQLWGGDVSLSKTYWFYGLGVTMCLRGIRTVIEGNAITLMASGYWQFLCYAWISIFLTCGTFILVATAPGAARLPGGPSMRESHPPHLQTRRS